MTYWSAWTLAQVSAEILRLRDVVNSPASGRLEVEHAANLLVEMRRDLARKES